MGMYTGLRARVKIKSEYRAEIQRLHDTRNWDGVNVPNINKWLKFDRNIFIPYGGLCYMPDGFGEPFGENSGRKFDGEWWQFSCSLKNYEGEIQFFLENIMKYIVEEIDYCHYLYEEYQRYEDISFKEYIERPWILSVTHWNLK